MSKAQYDIFIDKVKTLAKTLVVKSEATADAINKSLTEVGTSVNDADPTTWKYYLNLSGQYHVSDKPMTVISLDTLQTIDFTRENLQIHLATAREYTYDSPYYNALLANFPDQEALIWGVLHPVDINVAIAAEDSTILWFDNTLVESNEENLIPGLQHWLNAFMTRWDVVSYRVVDDLYAGSQIAMRAMGLVLEIISIREQNCKTRYAHSYHVREYLASNGRLDAFVDSMTTKQMLWLYRNILYIERNAGKQATFEWLTQNILTDRGLPLVGWGMRHNLENMPGNLVPDVEFEREPINYGVSSAGADTRTVIQMLDAENGVAKGNIRVEPDAEITVQQQFENSLEDRLPTKVLESSILDMTDATPFTLSACLLNHWLYFAQTGLYNAVITVDNPHTGGTYTFDMLDAFIVWLYAYNASVGVILPTIPTIQAIHVIRTPYPTKTELLGVIDQTWASPKLVDAAIAAQVLIPRQIISTQAFYSLANQLHDMESAHRFLYATREHYISRGLTEIMTQRFYQDYRCDFGGAGQTYASWFQSRGLDIPTLSDLEQGLLATQLLSVATGANLKTAESLKDMQAAMLSIMSQLSSYSVQYLQSINTDPIQVPDSPVIRVGDRLVSGGDDTPVDALDVRLVDWDAYARQGIELDLADKLVRFHRKVREHQLVDADFTLDFNYVSGIEYRERIPLADIRIQSVDMPISQVTDVSLPTLPDYAPLNSQPLTALFATGSSTAYALSTADRATLASTWATWSAAQGDLHTPLDQVITVTSLDGLTDPGLD